jgi:histone deacetylase complex regulatory component SIN3
MERAGLSEAIRFINEVRIRFHHEEGVYKCFLDVVNVHRKGFVDLNYVRVKVGALFEDHPDLLDRFLSFASDSNNGKEEKENKSLASMVEVLEKHGLKGAYDRGRFLFKKIAGVLGRSEYVEFLTHCRRYGSGEIDRGDLNRLVAGVLGGLPGLLDEFYAFLEGDKSLGLGTTTKKRKRSEDYLSDKPKFSNCRRGRTPNLQDDYEDKRYEIDMLLASMTSATEAAEKLLNEINGANPENPIRIGECLSAMNLRCIEKIYGDRGSEIVHVLRESPRDALPVIVPRLQQKLEEVKEWATSFSFKNYICSRN